MAYRLDADGGYSVVIFFDFPRGRKGVPATPPAGTPAATEVDDEGWFTADAGRDLHREGLTPSVGWHVGGRWRPPERRAA